MGKRRITFRFYKRTDRDLIGLYLNPTFNFPAALKSVLIAYVRGEPIQICPPRTVDVDSKDLERLSGKIVLDTSTEGDVIKWLDDMIDSGCRNSFLKNLFRGSLPGVNLCVYSSNPKAVSFEDKLNKMIDTARLVSYDVGGVRKVKVVLSAGDRRPTDFNKARSNIIKPVKPVANRVEEVESKPAPVVKVDDDVDFETIKTEPEPMSFSPVPDTAEPADTSTQDTGYSSFLDDIDALF